MNAQPAAKPAARRAAPRTARRTIGAGLTTLALTGLTLAAGATAAEARPLPTSYAHLYYHGSSSHTGKSSFSVEGRYGAASLTHAKSLITKGMDMWFMGDDTGFDDYLCGVTDPTWLFAKSDGAYFAKTFSVPTSELNEDWGKDEVYAEIYLYGDGGRTIYSNNVARSF